MTACARPKTSAAGASAPRHTVQLVPLPPIDLIDAPYAADPVAVLFDNGGEDGAALVAGLEQRGFAVRRAELGGDPEQALTGRVDLCLTVLDCAEWTDAENRLRDTILVAKHAVTPLTAAATRAAFVTVTRLDGGLGLHGRQDLAPALLGGVGGLVKTLACEAPDLFCRAVDVDPVLDREAFVGAVLDELHDAALDTAEVGIDATRARHTVVPSGYRPALERSTVDKPADVTVGADDTLVVTGGARGVTALCVRELATHTSAAFLLLGRTELTDEPGWAQGVPDAELKPAAIKALRESRPTPREIDRTVQNVLALREIRGTLAALGTRAQYLAVDVTDAGAVRDALAGHRITGVVHGAGVLADALLVDKTADQVSRVFGAKLAGLRAVLDAVDELRHLVLFTSVAGLLGNSGQADYAVANEALCRVAASWKRLHPDSHVTAIDWGAWDGGMVTPELRELFAARGVPLLHPAAGATAFAEQFSAARHDETCVLIGEDKSLAQPGAVRSGAFTASRSIAGLEQDPVIQAHRIGEHAVLPATFGLGWLINVVERAHPGLGVVQVRDFQVHKGILFDGSPRDEFRVEVEEGDLVRASVRSERASHYAGTFLLAPKAAEAPSLAGYRFGEGPEDALEIYHEATQFHGPRLQGMRRVLERTDRRMVLECRLVDAPMRAFAGRWHSPVLADLLLQGPPVLGKQLLGQACLPLGIGRADYFAALPDDEPFALILDDVRTGPATVTVTATACDGAGRVLQRFADVTVVSTPDMAEKFRESVRQWKETTA